MTFFERYEQVCRAQKPPVDPCSRTFAQAIGVDKSTTSKWKANGTTPNGEVVRAIADQLHVSTDYLLNRTDDPMDYATRKPGRSGLTGDQKKLLQRFDSLQEPFQKDMLEYMDFLLAKQGKKQESVVSA